MSRLQVHQAQRLPPFFFVQAASSSRLHSFSASVYTLDSVVNEVENDFSLCYLFPVGLDFVSDRANVKIKNLTQQCIF